MKAWVCRDKDNTVWLTFDKPEKDIDSWWFHEGKDLYNTDFPSLTFENSPVEVEMIEKSTLDEVYKGLDQYEEFLGVVANMRELQKEQMTADIRWENLEYYKERDRMMFELEQMVDKWLEGEAL